MTYLSSSWQLWKLQFTSGLWLPRLLNCLAAIFLAAAIPFAYPRWGTVAASGLAVFLLCSSLTAGRWEYRAFGMNRMRAAAHTALTVAPLSVIGAGLALIARTDGYGLAGAALSLVAGGLIIASSDPLGDMTYGRAVPTSGVGLPRSGDFASRTLWAPLLVGSVTAGLLAAAVEIIVDSVGDGEALGFFHGFVWLCFVIWVQSKLGTIALVWDAFGLSRKNWAGHLCAAGFIGPVVMSAVAAALLLAADSSGLLPTQVNVTDVLLIIAIAIPPAVIGAIAVASAAGGKELWAIATAVSIRGPLHDVLNGSAPYGAAASFLGVVSFMLLILAVVNLARKLSGNTQLSGRKPIYVTEQKKSLTRQFVDKKCNV